ncbi:hypothetical protein OROHE_021673 [Orobanche hederae]
MATTLHLRGFRIPHPSCFKRASCFQPVCGHGNLHRMVSPFSGSGSCRSLNGSRGQLALRVSCVAGKVGVLEKHDTENQVSDQITNELTCVMKFGGSSVASADRMREIAELILSFPEERPVVVLSAMGKTTNKLLLAGEKAVTCGVSNVSDLEELTFIKDLHLSTVNELGVERSIIEKHLFELEQLLNGIAIMKEMTPRTMDYLVSFGECMSTRVFAAYLNKIGAKARQDDIVLIEETKVGVQQKLELWRDTLEARGFRLSRSKTEYMECRFSDNSDREAGMITFDGKVVHGSTFFRYLGSIIQKDGELDGDVAHGIKAGWLKWKSATGVLCDPGMSNRLKGKFYRTTIRPALLYGTECWAVKQCHVQKMNVAEMRMLRWMCGHTKNDRLRNEVIREKVRVASIEEKMMENRLRWFGHVRRRPVDAPVRRLESWGTSNIVKGRGRPKKTWIKLIENDMRFLGIGESMAMERQIWRERIRVYDAFEIGFITTDDFTNADILEATYPSVAKRLCGDWLSDPAIPIVTGFLGKGWRSGAVTTLGRGGSDLTATTIGKALGLREIQVWKDVDGVLTCDPNIYSSAEPVPYLTFDEAAELAYFGAQVLHPQSMRPAREGDIPVRVKNSYNPKAPGTLITRTRDMSQAVLTSIVLKRNVTMLDIVSTRMLGQFGFLAKVFSTFEDLGISVDVVATSEVSISLTLDPSKLWSRELIQQELDHVVEELEKIAVVNLLQNRSIISLIGNVQRSSLILEKTFHVLRTSEVNVQMISQGASKVNISFIVNDSEAEECVRALHSAFFESDLTELVSGRKSGNGSV